MVRAGFAEADGGYGFFGGLCKLLVAAVKAAERDRPRLFAALGRAGVDTPRPPCYDSPWRETALREATETDDAEP